jgi:L-threonylcarbamoyladenylate synthase
MAEPISNSPGESSGFVLDAPELAARLASGGAVMFPTDTLPALAASPLDAAQIWHLKRRPADKPLILMAADTQQLRDVLGLPWRAEWLQLAAAVWPGAVTLVLPASGSLAEALHPGGSSLGLRIPACAAARDLLRQSGPLATTSINRSGEQAASNAAEAKAIFPQLPLLGPLPWPAGAGIASRVLAWREQSWQLLRGDALPPQLATAINEAGLVIKPLDELS